MSSGAAEGLAMSIYPNPARDRLVLDIFGGEPPYRIRVTDMLGREVFHQPFNTMTPVISTSGWTEGIYLIQVVDVRGMRRQQLVMMKP